MENKYFINFETAWSFPIIQYVANTSYVEVRKASGIAYILIELIRESEYIEEKLNYYLAITCLRGITWCSMAFIEYQNPDKLIRNEFTYNKIKKYLEVDFLNNIMKSYFI